MQKKSLMAPSVSIAAFVSQTLHLSSLTDTERKNKPASSGKRYTHASRETSTVRGKRNKPCPCGSGVKFKKCCLKPISATYPTPQVTESDEQTKS